MTAQAEEWLILDGKRVAMAFCPPLPPDKSLLYQTTNECIVTKDERGVTQIRSFEHWTDARGKKHSATGGLQTSACWRGYQGTWELKAKLFYLVNISGCFRPSFEKPILADWFTGVLRIKSGRVLQYVHMGYGTVTEFETHIAIEQGREMGRRSIDNTGKSYDRVELGRKNLPGRENFFPGDSEI